MLTISKLKRWSINYYIDTAQAAEDAARDLRAGGRRAGGVLLRARNPHPGLAVGRRHPHRAAALVGLTDAQRAGGDADARWWRAGSTTGSLPTVHTGAHSVSAVCTGSI